VKRFQSFFSLLVSFFPPLITCVHHVVDNTEGENEYIQERQRERERERDMYIVKKASRFRTIIDLLLVLVLSPVAFFLFELLDTIRGRSSETNLVKRMTKERK